MAEYCTCRTVTDVGLSVSIVVNLRTWRILVDLGLSQMPSETVGMSMGYVSLLTLVVLGGMTTWGSFIGSVCIPTQPPPNLL